MRRCASPPSRRSCRRWFRSSASRSRNGGSWAYERATETSRSLLNWWLDTPHLLPQPDGTTAEFQYYFAQREALETIIYLYDVMGVKYKYDLLRFDISGAVSSGMFDETWRRFVVKMATGSGKTKVMSLVLAWCYFHELYEPGSELARNFLLITPNIIVLDRIYKDFSGLRIFFQDPVLPDAPSRARLGERQSSKYTEKYADYIHLGVTEWRKAYAEHEKKWAKRPSCSS